MTNNLETGKWIVKSLGGVLVLSLAAGTGMAQSASQTTSSDAQVQSAITSALGADAQLHGQQVTASVQGGVVTLNGNVNDDSARLAAEQTAAQIAGVKSIEDNISVGQQQAQNQPQNQPDQQGPQDQQAMQPNEQNNQQSQAGQMPPPPPQESAPQQPQYQQQPYSQPQGQYGQQQPYAQPQGQYQQPYGYQSAPAPRPLLAVSPQRQNASGPVTIPAGTLLTVRTNEALVPGKVQVGTLIQVTATSDIYEGGVVAIPRGSILSAQVTEAKKAGAFGGAPRIDLKLTNLTLGGQTYDLASEVWSNQGPSKTGYTAANTVGGAAFGALIGAIAGGGVGAGIGAVAGGATGAAVSGATPGPRVGLPPEAVLQFHLTAPIEVQPVKYDEAVRLASTIPQQPVLRARPVYPAYYAVRPYPYYPRYYAPGYY
jgi:hypothetical protein